MPAEASLNEPPLRGARDFAHRIRKEGTMNILGISSLDNVSAATLLCDGNIVAAVAEERMTRVKLQAGFPALSIDEVLRIGGLAYKDIDAVTYPFYVWQREAAYFWQGLARNAISETVAETAVHAKVGHLLRYGKWCLDCTQLHRRYGLELARELEKRGWANKLHRVEHHHAHAASAYLTSGVSESLILTLDWYGGGLAGSVSIGRPNGITRIKDFHYPHSLGMFYAYVTAALNFKPARHEGKIVGLAAFGDPSLLYDRVRHRLRVVDGDLRFLSGMDMAFVRDLAARYPREHVAAAFQKVLEDVVHELTQYYVRVTGLKSVVLAGGVAANVKMNQRVLEVDGVEHVFVHPAMGDEGTSTGGALDLAFRKGEVKTFELKHAYLGPEYSETQLKSVMESAGLQPVYHENIEEEIARRIADDQVVAHFDGRMEYGPRALGNRSILYQAKDPTVNDWLNKRLRRTEFMPFAPATAVEDADTCYHNVAGAEHTARYMTITFNCTEAMKRQSPAAVHVDGTARPQLVHPDHSPRFYKILKAYKARTGIPSVINTSFNIHEEPIVCSPEDAVRTVQEGRLDVLVMGHYVADLPQVDAG